MHLFLKEIKITSKGHCAVFELSDEKKIIIININFKNQLVLRISTKNRLSKCNCTILMFPVLAMFPKQVICISNRYKLCPYSNPEFPALFLHRKYCNICRSYILKKKKMKNVLSHVLLMCLGLPMA